MTEKNKPRKKTAIPCGIAHLLFPVALLSAIAGIGISGNAHAQNRVLLDYDQFDLPPTMATGSELVMAATLGQASRPLLDALEQRFISLRRITSPPPVRLASLNFEVAQASDVQPASNLWESISRGWLRNTAQLVDFAGDQTAFTLGFDHHVLSDLTLGLSLSRDQLDLSTHYNGGQLSAAGLTIAPYMVWNFDESFSVDATAGFTRSRIEQHYAPDVQSGGVHAKSNAYRGLAAGNFNYTTLFDSWIVGGKVGTLLLSEREGSFVDSSDFAYPHRTNTLGQAQTGGNVGRIFQWGSVNVSAAYLYDYNHLETVSQAGQPPPSVDRDGVLLNANLYANVASGMTFNLGVSREFFRTNVDNTFLTAMLMATF